MMTQTVYRYTPKALRRVNDITQDDRLILMGDGSAVWYQKSTGRMIQSDMLYERPDSHIAATTEQVPELLTVSQREWGHIERNSITMPCRIERDERW